MQIQIVGIGCDIVSISRIEECIKRFGGRFISRIFSNYEIEFGPKIESLVYYSYFARRFAAKEACAKALGIGIGKLSFKEIEVRKDEVGAPYINIESRVWSNYKFYLSLSDENDIALAYVIATLSSNAA